MTSTPPGGGPERPGHELQRALYEMFNGPADEDRPPAEDEQVRDDPAAAAAPEPQPEPEPENQPDPDTRPLLAAFAAAESDLEPATGVDIEDVPAPVAEPPGPDLYADPEPLEHTDDLAYLDEQPDEPDGQRDARPAAARSRRRWIPAAVVAAALTAVAGAGLFLDLGAEDDPRAGSGDGAGESQPADDPDGSPPVEIADFLASSDVMYGDVAAAVTSAGDVAALVEAAQVAADAQSEAADLVTTSATLDPLPAPTESDVLARRSDFIAAVAGFTALETGTLANFGELATALSTSADELDRAEVTLDLATTETDQAADQTSGAPLVLAAAQEPADGETAAATVAAHLTGVVGADAVETATADALDLVGQLELAEVTADVRAAAGDAAGVAAYVSAAAAGFPDDSTTAGQLAALTDLLTPIGQLTSIDGESLRTWDSVGPTLAEAATSLDGLLAASTQAAHGHLDDLVGSARATIAAWEAEVAEAQRSGGGSDAGLETYAAAVAAHLETYDGLIAQLPQLSGAAQPSSSQGVALYRLARSFESLQADVATVVAPGAMTNAHASVVALVDAGTQAAVQGEAASRSAEACRGAGRSSAECKLGAQPQWSQYSGAVGTARTNGSVASGWQSALEAARASTGRVDAPPRPVV